MAYNSSGPLNNLSQWELDGGVLKKLKGTGFDTLRNFAKDIRLNLSILEVLIDNYDSVKQAFVLGSSHNCFNITFGLEDVLYLTGLPIDGEPVTGVDPADTRAVCQQYLGISEGYGSKGGIKLKWLKDNFMHVPKDLAEEDERFDYYVRAYVMYVIGCTFAPSARMTVSSAFLPLLANVAAIGSYAWGAAYLACLHHDMGTGNKSFSGFYFPLLVFAYMRFPGLLCGVDINHVISDKFPLVVNWSNVLHDVMRNSFAAHQVEALKTFFKDLKEEETEIPEVVWRPYAKLSGDFLPPHLREQLVLRTSQTILICFEKAVHHRPDVCQRQLGLEGLGSVEKPIKITTKQRTGSKADIDGTDWRTKKIYQKYISKWNGRRNLLIDHDVEEDFNPVEDLLNSGLQSHDKGDSFVVETASVSVGLELLNEQKKKKKKVRFMLPELSPEQPQVRRSNRNRNT